VQITVELSLYPLTSDFEEPIISFIKILKSHAGIEVHTHSMSSYIKGECNVVFNAISNSFELVSAKTDTISLVVKIVNRDFPVNKGFIEF
jgi:uncharacterized protein YqgV (UPF0045/DUF77 family)